ncbi:MAG: tetratricopeptide repeat protein [Bacteroides sp.]|nr:tetratricopeptide repeat protein [Bacteroides sp.]
MIFKIFLSMLLLMPSVALAGNTKQERNYIVEGNNLYRQQRYAEAETMYKKALTVSPASEVAKFNLASALIRQNGSTDANNGNTPLSDAEKLLTELAENAQLASIVERSAYDLGNIAFNRQDYKGAIERYKQALRKNPDNDKARENLRLAQKKLQQQQQQNQDKNKDQNKEQDKQQQQQQQDQQQNQQNQNKDQDKKDSKPDQPQDKKDSRQQPQQQPQGGISDENANKILKAMENEEAATRKKIEARKQKADNSRRRQVSRPW